MSQPLVSVCIPTWCAGPFLRATLESVAGQSYSNLEIVVCDDASTDDTIEIAQSLGDARIRVVAHTQNLGPAGNWERALKAAQGEYVKLLCQDDLLKPDCIAAQVKILSDPSHADAVLTTGRRDVVDAMGKTIVTNRGLLRGGTYNRAQIARAMVRSGTNPVGEPLVGLFRRSVLQQLAPPVFSGQWTYMIDCELWMRLLERGSMIVTEDNLGAFRVSAGALSTRHRTSQSQEARAFFAELGGAFPQDISGLDRFCGAINSIRLNLQRRALYWWLGNRRQREA